MASPDLPFLPYGRQSVDEDDIASVVEVLRSDYLTTGPAVAAFEEDLAQNVGARYAVAVNSGTMALHAAYFAAGVGEGDEVVVPAITFLATANAALYLGAEPRFCDVDPNTGLMTADTLAPRISERTRVVAPVHLNGMPVDLAVIESHARRVGAVLIEDAAHALGASFAGRRVGACRRSAMAIFSFHPVKHVTTGEGGAVVTNDAELYEKLRSFRNHGMVSAPERLEQASPGPWYYEQQALGYNGRITDIQCALGRSQLAKLDRFVTRRRQLASRYDQALQGVPGIVPVPGQRNDAVSAYHLYAVLIDFARFGKDRAEVMLKLRERGIGSQVHYIPVPAQPYYRKRGCDPDRFPGAQRYYERELSLPMYPALADSDVDRVVGALLEVLGAG